MKTRRICCQETCDSEIKAELVKKTKWSYTGKDMQERGRTIKMVNIRIDVKEC